VATPREDTESGRRSVAGLFGAPPPVEPSSSTPLFIDVPNDFMYVSPARAPSAWDLRHDPQELAPGYVNADTGLGGRLRGSGTTGVLPRYRIGDERTRINGLTTENLARLQQGLAKAGLIGPDTDIHVGLADEKTIDAYRKLLGYANQWGVTEDVALDRLLQQPIAKGKDVGEGRLGGGGESRTQTSTSFSFTDPAAAQELVRRALRDEAGMEPSQEEYQRFVSALRGAEQASPSVTTTTYDEAGNATSTTTGGDTDPTALASSFVMQERGDDINAYRTLGYYQAALQAIGPGGGMLGGG